ncbi:MAG: hypothetical protein EBW33_04735, partial [Actinobacteria bacterium]|nr:hypothetical protein [Actinomycetota bacterium]
NIPENMIEKVVLAELRAKNAQGMSIETADEQRAGVIREVHKYAAENGSSRGAINSMIDERFKALGLVQGKEARR